ncbi:hypothetical protein ACLESO_03970 [Pyxidicoccus sp. 3LG]
MDTSATLPDFSLVRGGPLFRTELRMHLVRPRRYRVSRLTLVVALLAWLPLLLLSLFQGGAAARAFIGDIQVHVQLLVSLSALILAEPYVDGRISLAARQFVLSHLIGVGSRPAFDEAIRSAIRLRDNALVEVLLLIPAFALSLDSVLASRGEWSVTGAGAGPSPAGWWYLAVSSPLFRFLLLRWLWRGLLWAYFLFRVSRLPLTLVPTHPDIMGGLGFLPTCQSSFAPVVFAMSAVTSSQSWEFQSSDLSSNPIPYVLPLAVFAVLATVFVFAPLAFFIPQLVRAKRRSDPSFSALAAWHSRRFERKWFSHVTNKEILGAPDFSSLADLGTSYILMRRMRLFPWDQRSLLAVVGAALAPLAVVLILDRQFLHVVKQLREGLP